MTARTAFLTLLTLVAFAANSVLGRLALAQDLINPVAFTQIRLLSGALILMPFLWHRRAYVLPFKRQDVVPTLSLFIYAIAFSLAYITLDAGVGALILFALVQITMVSAGIMKGNRPGVFEWTGMVLAFAGLVYLFAPGLTAPSLSGASLMATAGIAWGVYSILGKSEQDPIASTARNFVFTVPLVLLLFLANPNWQGAEWSGIGLAITSGAITSGLGYVIWYITLKGLTTMTASVVQLAVPIIAALGGVLLISEPLTLRLILSASLILGGILIVIRAGARKPR
jgi:drug/metabolite transporter (DMT)-like permease